MGSHRSCAFLITYAIMIVNKHKHYYYSYYLDIQIFIDYNTRMKKITNSVQSSFTHAGKHLKAWRMIYMLKATQVAQRAGISLGTLNKIESGDPSVGVAAFLEVTRSLGLLDNLVDSLDPLNSDLGRARVNESLPKRIR